MAAAGAGSLSGRNRQGQKAFVAFRSYYLFERRYCMPGQAHEKGGVESDAGYALRDFRVPVPSRLVLVSLL